MFLHTLLSCFFLPLRCSAHSQGIDTLSHEEPSNTASVQAVAGELLTGYYSDIQYSDAACSAVLYAESFPLNTCCPWIDGNSYQVSANSTHTATYIYSDYSCETLTSNSIESSVLQVCGKTLRTLSVTASYYAIKSSEPLLSAA